MNIINKLINKVSYKLDAIPFLIRNLYMARSLESFKEEVEDGIIYRPLIKYDFKVINNNASLLPNKKSLRWSRRFLYHLAGEKLAIVAEERSTGRIIGIQMFYFNTRDIRETTIHSTYTGVLTTKRAKGIGTKLLHKGGSHFYRHGISGISGRISLKNAASLKMCVNKLKFTPIEKYAIPSTNEEWYYLVWYFNESNINKGNYNGT